MAVEEAGDSEIAVIKRDDRRRKEISTISRDRRDAVAAGGEDEEAVTSTSQTTLNLPVSAAGTVAMSVNGRRQQGVADVTTRADRATFEADTRKDEAEEAAVRIAVLRQRSRNSIVVETTTNADQTVHNAVEAEEVQESVVPRAMVLILGNKTRGAVVPTRIRRPNDHNARVVIRIRTRIAINNNSSGNTASEGKIIRIPTQR